MPRICKLTPPPLMTSLRKFLHVVNIKEICEKYEGIYKNKKEYFKNKKEYVKNMKKYEGICGKY